MGGRREDRREDDGGRHDDDKKRGHEQAAEISLDRRDHAAHGVEDSKATIGQTSGLGPSAEDWAQAGWRSVERGAAAGAAIKALRLRTYSCTRETTVA